MGFGDSSISNIQNYLIHILIMVYNVSLIVEMLGVFRYNVSKRRSIC